MDLEGNQDDFMGSNDLTQIIEGKRTKRQRSSSPYKATVTSSSSSGYGVRGGWGGHGERGVIEEYGSILSPTSSSDEVYESTEEEEDMANCLILLAQGDGPTRQVENNKGNNKTEKFSARKLSEMITPSINKAGFYVYECKTCNRSFPSFQALGGHRASHKKPKATIVEEKKVLGMASSMEDLDHHDCQLHKSSPDHHDGSVSLQISINNNNSNKGFHGTNKRKIHECSICGSEFMSGQALGGHMRRHRPNTVINQVGMSVDSSSANGDHDHHMLKPTNMLGLDLNLPAPEDHDHHLHHHENKFRFASTQQAALVFSAPTLVDCHY